ncbi:acyl-CoA thioesterase [Sandarakinorhabdus sp.]|uniref:acyl-CoA thioesterase n=1 Tax=Sandarakinorhabdus sp. TaxID=1916663 RepID=UPI00286E7A2F|nr:acyl-CoA thioesterase [Sandarakinorhabdus sp.]
MPAPADRTAFSMTVTAQPADIDIMGHVNNAVYVRWVQEVATEHLAHVVPQEHTDRMFWLVTRHEIDYLAATLEGETVTLTTWVGTPKGARFDRFVDITGPDGKLRVRAHTTWALLDREAGRLMRVTPDIAAPFMGGGANAAD